MTDFPPHLQSYGQKGRILYEAFCRRTYPFKDPTPWNDQTRAIRIVWMSIARDADMGWKTPTKLLPEVIP